MTTKSVGKDRMSFVIDCALIVALLHIPATASAQKSTLTSPVTEKAVKSLKITDLSDRELTTKQYRVTADSLPEHARASLQTDIDGQASLPFMVSDMMLVQFVPNAEKAVIEKFLKERNLKVVDTYPTVGAIKVRADLSKYFTPVVTDKDQNATLLRGMNAAVLDFKTDPIVRSATPDLVLNKQSAAPVGTNFFKPSEVNGLTEMGGGKNIDWGISNIEADRLWIDPRAQGGALIGILDVGFAWHRDLVFLDLPDGTPIHDHGNHVAGIACARGTGVRGVLPNCFIRARTGDMFFRSPEGGDASKFIAVFSQILGTLDKFISEHDDLRVINVSMGYNWMPNFNINPDDPESVLWRVMVEQQGLMLMTALERADKDDKVIYSAAGNDSGGLTSPIKAKYASALNWAATTAREKQIADNGIIVEAHDQFNKRASFSNIGGNISCPGVDVVSTVAYDTTGKQSREMYGKMSGTSMASPYCAAAHLLFRLVRPGYSGREIAKCLMSSSQKSDSGTAVLKLTEALKQCPDRRP